MTKRAILRRFASARHTRCSSDEGVISAFESATLELFGNDPIGFTPPSKHEHAGNIAFQALVDTEVYGVFRVARVILGQPPVDIVAAFGSMRRDKRRFVHDHEIRILEKDAVRLKEGPDLVEGHGDFSSG